MFQECYYSTPTYRKRAFFLLELILLLKSIHLPVIFRKRLFSEWSFEKGDCIYRKLYKFSLAHIFSFSQIKRGKCIKYSLFVTHRLARNFNVTTPYISPSNSIIFTYMKNRGNMRHEDCLKLHAHVFHENIFAAGRVLKKG